MHCGVGRGFELEHPGGFAASPWAAAMLGHHSAVTGGGGLMPSDGGYPHPGGHHHAAMPMDLHVPQGFSYYR